MGRPVGRRWAFVFCIVVVGTFLVGCGSGCDSATTFRLRIEAGRGGTVSPTGTTRHNLGTRITVVAIPNEGYIFTGWSGASDARTSSVRIIMNSNQTLTANFERFTPTFTDSRDGKIYRRVRIGNLIWMAENLNYGTDNSWCYDNNESNCQKFGRLYTWNAAMVACPVGWRLPSYDDWHYLVRMAGGGFAGMKLKSKPPDWDGTDDFGFSALPAGFRDTSGGFWDVGTNGHWWSATEDGTANARNRGMSSINSGVGLYWFWNKRVGLSLRCVVKSE